MRDILLDTGCSRILVQRKFVPEQKISQHKSVAICCAHGDTVVYPLAQVKLKVDGQVLEVEATISVSLPMTFLLGTDVSQLPENRARGHTCNY